MDESGSDFNRIHKYKILQQVAKETGIPYIKVEKVIDFFEEFVFRYLYHDGSKPLNLPLLGKFYKVTKKVNKANTKKYHKYVQDRRKLLEDKPSFEDILRRHLQGGQK